MTIDTSENAPPLFLSANYLNRHADAGGDLLLSTGGTLRHRLYDMDPRARWISAGSNDTITETAEFGLWLPGTVTTRDLDYIALMNHNLLELSVERSTNGGGSWSTVYSSATIPAAELYTRISLPASVSANRIRVNMVKTKAAAPNDEKRLGGIIVAQTLFQASRGLRTYERGYTVGHKTARMADGSTRRAYIYRSDASFGHYRASISFVGVSADERVTYREQLLHRAEPFIFVPEPGRRPEEAYLCQIVPGTFTDNWMRIGRPDAGSVIAFDVEEVGGA